MNYVKRPLGLFFMSVMLIMAFQISFKKPLCIDSNIVYKIDSLASQKKESIFSCSQAKKINFSPFFYDNKNLLEAKLKATEIRLSRLNIQSKFAIAIDAVRTQLVEIKPNSVLISTDLLDTEILEHSIFKLGLARKLLTQDDEFLNVVSDFYFLNSQSEYKNLLSQAWNEAFLRLDFLTQRRVFIAVTAKLRNAKLDERLTSLQKLLNLLDESSIADEAQLQAIIAFKTHLNQSLQILGFLGAPAQLDLVLEVADANSVKEKLIELSLRYPQKKVVVQDPRGRYLLPAFLPISTQPKTHYQVVISSERVDKKKIEKYLQHSDKLIFIEADSSSKSLDLSPIFSRDMQVFLTQNKKIKFIQFDLASFNLKLKELSSIKDYFAFVKQRANSEQEYAPLGWKSTLWNSEMKAYKPLAAIDAIQFFRIN